MWQAVKAMDDDDRVGRIYALVARPRGEGREGKESM